MPNFYKNKSYNESYNKNYNPRKGVNTSTSLYSLLQKRDLTNCLEHLEKLGYSEESAVVVLASVQLIAGFGGAA